MYELINTIVFLDVPKKDKKNKKKLEALTNLTYVIGF